MNVEDVETIGRTRTISGPCDNLELALHHYRLGPAIIIITTYSRNLQLICWLIGSPIPKTLHLFLSSFQLVFIVYPNDGLSDVCLI